MKSSKNLFRKSSFSRSRAITLTVFVVAFGGYGVYKLAFSKAATPTTTVNYNYNYINVFQPQTPLVNDYMIFQTRPIKAFQLTGTQNINYTTVGVSSLQNGTALTQINACYTLRAVSTAAVVRIYGYNTSKQVTVKPARSQLSSGGFVIWQYSCINQPYTSGSQESGHYGVDHISGGAVNVYSLDKQVTYNY